MSKNITMWWDGDQRNYNGVKKIQAPDVDGQRKLWIPEDETTRGGLTVYQNGEYTAAANNLYGFSSVIVDIQQATSVTGHGQDGNDYTVTVDPETGEIVETVAPSKIGVIQLPTKMVYQEGETIDYTGIVVQAYDAKDNIWSDADHPNGIIPFNELTFPVTIAHGEGSGGKVIDDTTGLSQGDIDSMPVDYCLGHEFVWSDGRYSSGADDGYPYVESYSGADPIYAIAHGYANPSAQWEPLLCSKSRFTATVVTHNSYGVYRDSVRVLSQVINGKDVYYTQSGSSELAEEYEGNIRRTPLVESSSGNLAYIVLYGHDEQGSTQDLPVQWHRPSDYMLIENEITIAVTPSNT